MKIYEGKTCSIHYPDDIEDMEEKIIIKTKLSTLSIGLDYGEIQIDPSDILEFVAEVYVKPKLIRCIENTPAIDILLNQINPEE